MRERKGLIIISTFSAICLLIVISGTIKAKDTSLENTGTKAVNASQLKETIVTNNLRSPMPKDKNLIWCATQQMAWEKLSDKLKYPITLKNAQELSAVMNIHLADSGQLHSKSYWAFAYRDTEKNRSKLINKITRKFGNLMLAQLKETSPEAGFLLYSWFYGSQGLTYSFNKSDKPMIFNGKPVASWNCLNFDNDTALRRHINIDDYRNDDDFILSIECANLTEKLILAKVKPGNSLIQTINDVERRMVQQHKIFFVSKLSRKDVLIVPSLNFDILREFTGLSGKHVVMSRKKGPEEAGPVTLAAQRLLFKMNGEGDHPYPVAPSKTATGASGYSYPRRFVFDKPFLVLIQKDFLSIHPRFALWVANSELMIPMEKKTKDSQTMNMVADKIMGDRPAIRDYDTFLFNKVKEEDHKSMGIQLMGTTRPINVIKRTCPRYPSNAERQGEGARVVVQVVIGENGDVIFAKILDSSNLHFNKTCLKASRQWKFSKPLTKDGKPCKVYYLIPFMFTP